MNKKSENKGDKPALERGQSAWRLRIFHVNIFSRMIGCD